MAKRHPSLIMLSHDHHHGLALALRLKQGDTALLHDGWTHDRKAQAGVVGRFYADELRAHFAAEEEALFPVLHRHVVASRDCIVQLKQQHRAMEDAVLRIASAEGNMLESELVAFGELLERHIRIEERELFPFFEQSVPGGAAMEAGNSIARIHEAVRGRSEE